MFWRAFPSREAWSATAFFFVMEGEKAEETRKQDSKNGCESSESRQATKKPTKQSAKKGLANETNIHQHRTTSARLRGDSTDITVSRAGSQPPQLGPAENFTGTVRVERLFGATEPSRATGGLVTFEPGARTAWHTHPLGQTLIVTAGVGRVQQWGGPIQEISKGDTVRIPPNVKHWHGASPGNSMSHIAIGEQLDGKAVAWMEKVSEVEFNAPVPGQPPGRAVGSYRAQQLVGDVAPKLAELTETCCSATFGHGHNSRGAIAASSP